MKYIIQIILLLTVTLTYESCLYSNYYSVDSDYNKTDGITTKSIKVQLPNGIYGFRSINEGTPIYGYVNKSSKEFMHYDTFMQWVILPPLIVLIILVIANVICYGSGEEIQHSSHLFLGPDY